LIVTKSFSKQKTQVKMPEEEPMQTGIRVFISGNSGNKEMVTHQHRILMILDSLAIEHEVIDIANPGMDEARDFMRGEGKKKEGSRHVLPPQIFNGDKYCGDYDDFDVANEDDHLEEFLGIPRKGSHLEEGKGTADEGDVNKLEGQPAVNGEPEKSEALKEDIETTEDENIRLQNDHEGTLEENIDNLEEQKSLSRNSPELTNADTTHNSEQQLQIEENTRQELTEDEMLSQA